MVDKLATLTLSRPIVGEDGVMTVEARTYFARLSDRIDVFGEGSPEGVVEANQGQSYFDLNATTGNIHYIKKLSDIGGDKTMGWVLV